MKREIKQNKSKMQTKSIFPKKFKDLNPPPSSGKFFLEDTLANAFPGSTAPNEIKNLKYTVPNYYNYNQTIMSQQENYYNIGPFIEPYNTLHFFHFVPYEKNINSYLNRDYEYYYFWYEYFCKLDEKKNEMNQKPKRFKKKKKKKNKKKSSNIKETQDEAETKKANGDEEKFLEQFKNRILNKKSYLLI